MGAKLRVVFAYRGMQNARGAKIMRVNQLEAMAQAHLSDLYAFEQFQLPKPDQPRRKRQSVQALKGAVVILLKMSGQAFDEDWLAALRQSARAICVDYVDAPMGGWDYAIRSDRILFPGVRAVFKPFTKGFNAALANSNILINRDADDAVAYLGDDYPFLAASRRGSDILEAYNAAKEAYGGPEWLRGLEVMADVRRWSSPAWIMAELGSILKRFA